MKISLIISYFLYNIILITYYHNPKFSIRKNHDLRSRVIKNSLRFRSRLDFKYAGNHQHMSLEIEKGATTNFNQ